MKNPLLVKWEDRLQDIFDKIDHYLEDKYGAMYPLKPNRRPRGKGVGPDSDGLFDLAVRFTTGIGSEIGPGYVFRVKMATLSRVPKDVLETIEDEVVDLLEKELPEVFPGKELKVAREGVIYKVYGNLDLN
jgi:hypothetical protein